jgi:surface antigen
MKLRQGAIPAFILFSAILLLSAPASALNCVQYVRQATGMSLSGDAWKWWHSAAGRYQRGTAPETDAVMVFSRTKKMHSGHVAVVREVIDSRTIRIDHANWAPQRGGKGKVNKRILVQDVSDANDWSVVRVWYPPVNDFGRPYAVSGFIYQAGADYQAGTNYPAEAYNSL